jgi:DtxR family Mn-dependent transcriptional regulator
MEHSTSSISLVRFHSQNRESEWNLKAETSRIYGILRRIDPYGNRNEHQEESLYIDTAEAESVEMYLKAIWYIHERGEDVKVSSIAKLLDVKQPSVVQMLHKLNGANLVEYSKGRNIVKMTSEGEEVGKQMIRNTRLLEVLMRDALRIEVDEEMVCGIEHHMKKKFTDALCTLLNHPRECPHRYPIPTGQCCPG